MKKNSKSTSAKENVKAKPADESISSFRSLREGIETLAIAVVLCFLFKTFEAEAFVIPTGSMAPTLMGAHKDLNCPQCGFRYKISASEEVDEGNRGTTTARLRMKQAPPKVVGGTCPQCRFTAYFGNENGQEEVPRTYAGDRIFVYKYLYDQIQPQRWAVTVFRFPGGPQTNFIKRLVGLENETLRIHNGNLFIKPDGEERFKIARKPSRHLLAMLQVVNDNDYVNPKLHDAGWPMSWADENASEPAWIPSGGLQSFRTDGTSPTMRWLNYRHIVPSTTDWIALRQNRLPEYGVVNNPRLITDFCAYNSGIVKDPEHSGGSSDATFHLSQVRMGSGEQTICRADPESVGFNWNGELAVQCELDVMHAQGQFALRLIQGGVPFLCEIDLASGTATLSIQGCEDIFPPITVLTPIREPGKYQIRFANIDEQLRLWVNEKELTLERDGEYDELCERSGSPLRRDRSPTVLDLTPVSLGSQGAQVQVNHLRVYRDIYYIAIDPSSPGSGLCDLIQYPFYSASFAEAEKKNASILSDPAAWYVFGKTRTVEFSLGEGQFFMMGDNSAKSMDARVWRSMPGGGQYVSRNQMVGYAAAVYWPHGYHIPYFAPLAWFPNFKDMRFID
ncbi:MAG: S26 family signal peptidase [Planctomycetaceae bacterium]|nr:S26 family signal peptidase [Planctomycetaceae bacterium]